MMAKRKVLLINQLRKWTRQSPAGRGRELDAEVLIQVSNRMKLPVLIPKTPEGIFILVRHV